VNPGTGCVVATIPDKPWSATIFESQGKVEADCQIDIDLPVMPSSGWVILMDSMYSGVWLFSRIGESDIVYDIQDFRELYFNEFVLPRYLTMMELADASLHEMCCLVRLATLAQHAGIPLGDNPLPENLIGFVHSLQPVAFRVIQLPAAWQHKKATIECVDGLSGDGFLKVDGGRFGVYVDSGESTIKLTWLERSSPCICGSCGRVMTQEQWFSHRHGNSLTVLGREFVAKPLIDWPSVIDLVEQSLLDAIAKKSTSAPHGLEIIWASLQDSFRKRNLSKPMSPEDWVKAIFSSWRKLFHLVNGAKPDHDWASLWRSVEQYGNALTNLAIGKG